MRFHRGDHPEHGVRPQGAVAADGVGPEALEGDERRDGIGAVERPAVLLIGHGDDGKMIGELSDCNQCRPRLLDIHHRLDDEAVDAPFEESLRLLPKERHRLFKGKIAEGLDEMAGGADIPRHEPLRADGPFRNRGQLPVRFTDVCETVLSHLDAVRPEGCAVHDIRPGLTIARMDLGNRRRVRKTPGLRANPRGEAPLLKLGPHGTVQDQDLFPQKSGDSSLVFHGLFLSIARCSRSSLQGASLPGSPVPWGASLITMSGMFIPQITPFA